MILVYGAVFQKDNWRWAWGKQGGSSSHTLFTPLPARSTPSTLRPPGGWTLDTSLHIIHKWHFCTISICWLSVYVILMYIHTYTHVYVYMCMHSFYLYIHSCHSLHFLNIFLIFYLFIFYVSYILDTTVVCEACTQESHWHALHQCTSNVMRQ